MSRYAWFQGSAGIAGDMALGALIDAGAPVDEIRAELERLPIDGWRLAAETVTRHGVVGTKAVVETTDRVQPPRTAATIISMVEAAGLRPTATAQATSVFETLARAEGAVHGVDPGEVHFHEVGALDSIVDVVGTCVALDLLGIDVLGATHLTHGVGTVSSAHGVMANPPPAVVELSRGIPSKGVDLPLELTTPTGAALLVALAERWGPLPAGTIESTGFGAGSRELPDRPNHCQVVIGVTEQPTRTMPGSHPDRTVSVEADVESLMVLETNLDDVTGESIAYTMAALLTGGALDVWITPIIMKKGRPAQQLNVLVHPTEADHLAHLLFAETGTLGIRRRRVDRLTAPRDIVSIDVDGFPIAVKVGPFGAKAEYEDLVVLAERTSRSLDEARRVVDRAWRDQNG